ncbi:DUF2130 domain-containing protein [Weissella diestrammenae]|uniref:DUF2130 domain-containing protein n=1 Tax=Weissella diestrammenae TaxID=1162633 RepID=A0A7G9T4K9_9LACO|nr:DUF2130 domain-containing protein [Weissella diestrammenae]MCM0582059.1 DUF2130 domain-containing protein [Weissella diestrammenae]QNN75034.1 DUF2130 domain-containing protein [Weissella diestrammenae]
MSKINFHIGSQTELILDQDAKQGDIIDLTDEQNINTSIISDKIAQIVDDKLVQAKDEWQVQQDKQTKIALDVQNQQNELEVKNQLAQKELTLKDELNNRQTEIEALKAQIEIVQQKNASEVKNQLIQKEADFKETASKQQSEIERLQQKIETLQQNNKIELENELLKKDTAVHDELAQKEQMVLTLKTEYEARLKAANEQVEFYKDFKARQSTKEIGESLEQYALNEFNKIKPFAFPNAYFEKDNELSETNSKGDFIFRESQDNVEFISIMFDMKNEADTTATKHKNADFFKELNKDRLEKKTEYAVLVSMLEADSDLYNTGIVQVTDYEKMYVIRPQFLIQFIGVLRNAALNTVAAKKELEQVKSQNVDITNFETDLTSFKNAFGKNYMSASKNFKSAIDEIDKAIARMEAVKRSLTTSENQLRLANNKLDDVSVKKLTRHNPTMRAKFEEIQDLN